MLNRHGVRTSKRDQEEDSCLKMTVEWKTVVQLDKLFHATRLLSVNTYIQSNGTEERTQTKNSGGHLGVAKTFKQVCERF